MTNLCKKPETTFFPSRQSMKRLEEKSFVVLDVEEATGRPRLVAVLPVATNPRNGLLVSNNPINARDPLGLDAVTWGPITIPLGFEPGTPNAWKEAERAHEKRHRGDFWNGKAFTCPKWKLEQRGFEAAIPVLEKALKDASLSSPDRQYLEDRLSESKNIAGSEEMARAYANDPVDTRPAPEAFFGNDGTLYGP